MKKCFTLAVIILILNSCAVQKKQPYYFSWYTPKSRGTTIPPAYNKELGSEINKSVSETQLASQEQKLPANAEPSQIKLLRPKPRLSKIDAWKKSQSLDFREGTIQEEKLQPIEENEVLRMSGDPILLMTASILGLGVMGLIAGAKKTTTQITRWAKANPNKTKGLITGLHVPLLALGVMNGHNLYQLGYDVSNAVMYGFGAAAVLGFTSLSFMPREDRIVLPRQVNRKRLAVLGITLSSFLMMTGVGNKIEPQYPGTQLVKTVESIDQSVMYTSSTLGTDPDPVKAQMLKFQTEKDKKTKAGLTAGAAGFLIFLLVLLTCAGICLTVGGFAALAGGEVAIGITGILFGPLLIWAAIKGFEDVKARRIKKTPTTTK